jgi:hypothetical protein
LRVRIAFSFAPLHRPASIPGVRGQSPLPVLSRAGTAGGLADLLDDLRGHGLDLVLGQRALARLHPHRDGERLLARLQRPAGELVEDAHVLDQRLVGAGSARGR